MKKLYVTGPKYSICFAFIWLFEIRKKTSFKLTFWQIFCLTTLLLLSMEAPLLVSIRISVAAITEIHYHLNWKRLTFDILHHSCISLQRVYNYCEQVHSFSKWVRLNYATTHHLPPSPTTIHHQPKYIRHHHPPPPTTSQNISTTTHHQPKYIHHHPPPA